MLRTTAIIALCAAAAGQAAADAHSPAVIELGPRPFYLVDAMRDGELKDTLTQCMGTEPVRTKFSIGHRGAAMQFPEHTEESYVAAGRMGAGIIECDVTFTADKELVCRHAQNDLHTTTDILTTDLAPKCTAGFTPAEGETDATAECRTSDITLAEFRTLNGKMDAADATATTPEGYQGGTADWRTTLYATNGTLLTHAESIELIDALGADFTPELKTPSVDMPFDGYSQEDYAQAMIDEYKDAGIDPSRVWPQSFLLEDVLYWIEAEPEFGAQAVYLMDEYDIEGYSPMDEATWPNSMQELAEMGVRWIAPPTWMLVTVEDGEIVPSTLAVRAKEAGLGMITWTLERSGPLDTGGGWYFQSLEDYTAERGDGAAYELVDALAQDVGVAGIFSDWPATVTYYASCLGLD